jgi:hypothetical protein
MMDNETRKRIADYFDPWDLVEYLGISTEDIIAMFEDEVEERLDGIEEVMGYAQRAKQSEL